ncbi:MAG: serine/threonine protein kinase, partial [Gammaproteobacteria bacterium]|nr:serine/threonine protein kinase [Gammaproteobacteria bacterium]
MSQLEISHPYEALTPDAVLDAVEKTGAITDGRLLSLNSYENRVYQIGIEDAEPLIAKFYRPGRWKDEAILEEHHFAQELVTHEIPVVAPLVNELGETLHHYKGFRFALFPRRGGHWPELEDPEVRLRLGRFLGRIHAVGECAHFQHRTTISIEQLGTQPRQYLLEHEFLPTEYKQQYSDLSQQLLEQINERF